MKRRDWRWIGILMAVTLCTVLLTGCPNVSDEEMERLRTSGRELLKQALLENYGWKENDYQILSEKVIPKTAQGFSSANYQLVIGDRTVMAEVDISKEEVFTDYYGKEFEGALAAYLDWKMECSPTFREMSLQRLSFTFQPLAGKTDEMLSGTIPVSVSPEDFDAYLETCENDDCLNVVLKVAWYSKELTEIPEYLLSRLCPEKSKIPTCLIVEHFACEPDAELQLTDWVETRRLYQKY